MTLEAPLPDRRPVVLIGLAVACSLLGDVSMYTLLPIHFEALGLDPIQVGILLSANRWVRLVTNQIARRVLDRGRPRAVLALALAAGSVITLVYAAAPPFWVLLAARVAWGAAWSFIRHAGTMTSIGTGTPSTATRVVGIYNGAVQIGFIAGTLAGAALFDLIGFAGAFMVLAAVSAAGLAFDFAAFRFLPAPARAFAPSPRVGPARDMTLLIRGFVTTCVGVGSIISTLGFALRDRLGDSLDLGPVVIGVATLNGMLIALHYGVKSVGSPLIGAGVDRIGRHAAEIIAFSVGCAALVTAALLPAAAILVPAVIVFFIANVASWLSLVSRAGLAGSGSFARLMTAADLGAATGPLLGWSAIDRVGSPAAVFAIGAGLYAIALATAIVPARPASPPVDAQATFCEPGER